MIKFLTCIFICSTFVLSCSNGDKKNEPHLNKDTAAVAIINGNDSITYFKFDKDSVTVLPFEIDVLLNEKAKGKIINNKETMIINVSLTGTPKDTTLNAEDGQFYVASAEKEITYGQVAKFDNIKFSRKTFDQLTQKNVYLNVFVYSGRKSSPDNLLDCNIIADSISNIVNKKFTITGKLIGDH
jgi:hypothetical protein